MAVVKGLFLPILDGFYWPLIDCELDQEVIGSIRLLSAPRKGGRNRWFAMPFRLGAPIV